MDISHFINFRTKLRNLLYVLLVLTAIGAFLHWLGYSIYTYKNTPEFIKNSPQEIITVVFLIYLIAGFFFLHAFLRKIKIVFFSFKNRVYKFNGQDWPSKWIFTGGPEQVSTSKISIQSSRAGYLLKNHYWRNFRMTFEMKFDISFFRPNKYVGVIFRADDLDNYFMLEILQDQNFGKEDSPILKSGIKPHVKFKGGWQVFDIREKKFNFDTFKRVKLEVKGNNAYLYISGTLISTWILPTHVDIMYREAGNEKKEESSSDEKYVQEIPFRNKSGMIGFRAHPGQGAIIRGLIVEPL